MSELTLEYRVKFKWYAHPIACFLFLFTKGNCWRSWMYTIEYGKITETKL